MSGTTNLKIAVIFFLLCTSLMFAQQDGADNSSSMQLARSIELTESSEHEIITVDVIDGTKSFLIEINSLIYSGSLTMEIFDPKGNKQGNFSVAAQLKGGTKSGRAKEEVSGQLHRNYSKPMAGEWTVKLKPSSATGMINIQSLMVQ